jgi:hypothetical protein
MMACPDYLTNAAEQWARADPEARIARIAALEARIAALESALAEKGTTRRVDENCKARRGPVVPGP